MPTGGLRATKGHFSRAGYNVAVKALRAGRDLDPGNPVHAGLMIPLKEAMVEIVLKHEAARDPLDVAALEAAQTQLQALQAR